MMRGIDEDQLKQLVEAHCEEGETYHAKTLVEREGNAIEIDCRPSDAFATAIRVDAPIFIAEEILTRSGVTVDELGKLDEGKEEA